MLASEERPTRVVESEITVSTGGKVRVRWVEGELPVEVLIGPPHLGGYYYFDPADAHALGQTLIEHAVDSGYDPDTGETKEVA